MTFEIGDRVRLRNGWTEMIVTEVLEYNGKIVAEYVAYYNGKSYSKYNNRRPRYPSDFVYWNEFIFTETNPKKENQMTKLYKTIGEYVVRYGKFLTTNSVGEYVLEMTGTNGQVEAFSPEDIEEVVPYTIQIKSLKDSNHRIHCIVPVTENIIEGDILISDIGIFYQVIKIDTKSNNHKGNFIGRKLMTTPIETVG